MDIMNGLAHNHRWIWFEEIVLEGSRNSHYQWNGLVFFFKQVTSVLVEVYNGFA